MEVLPALELGSEGVPRRPVAAMALGGAGLLACRRKPANLRGLAMTHFVICLAVSITFAGDTPLQPPLQLR